MRMMQSVLEERLTRYPVDQILNMFHVRFKLKLVTCLFVFKDSSGIFWDNDSLAGLLAMELKADLLVMLSDVEGLYSRPPSDPNSKLIHTYIKEKHQCEITFGDKSRLGRGGMTAKVNAAVCAAYAGIPSVITRYVPEPNSVNRLCRCLLSLF